MSRVVELARRAGESDARVLITGESGVGKDLIAREIHARSPRRSRAYVAVNCAGLPETLLESELFGFDARGFRVAEHDRPGKLHMADGGTLFLDGVGEMSLGMQARLLRFLESGEIQRIGERPIQIPNVRLIAATSRNLPERVAAGEFREDLFYRLRVIEIVVPPLRERTADILALTEHFLGASPRQMALSADAQRALLRHRWPGNVRELQHVIEQAVCLAQGAEITLEDLPEALRTPSLNVATRERRRQVADQLYEALTEGHCSFWDYIHPMFLDRDLTRNDIRALLARGLRETKGNYRALLRLFHMPSSDYHRFHNFLAAHECKVDFHPVRANAEGSRSRPSAMLSSVRRPGRPVAAPPPRKLASSDT